MKFRYSIFILLACLSTPAASSSDVQSVIKVLNSIKGTLSQAQNGEATQHIDLQAGQHIPVGETLYLSTYLNHIYIGELTVVKSERAYLVEPSNFIDIFSLPITLTENTATGWFKTPDNNFSFNAQTKQVTHNAQSYALNEAQFMVRDAQIYVDIQQLQHWFDFTFATDYIQQSIEVAGQGHFGVEQSLARQNQHVFLRASQREALYPELETGYQAFSSPLFDLNTRYKQTQTDRTLSYALTGANELAYLRSEYFLAGESGDMLRDSRLTFSKQSASSELFGLNATELKFGDIQPVMIGARASGSLSQGVSLTNAPLISKTTAGRVSINGIAGEGWDIELYQNGVLIEQKLNNQAGVFFFDNIALFYGENVFEVIKYGTEGQIEKQTQRYFSDGIEEAGSSTYAVSLSRDGKRVFNRTDDETESGDARLSGRFEHVFSSQFSAYLGASAFTEQDESVSEFATGVSYNPTGRMLFNLSHQGTSADQYRSEATARFLLSGQRVRVASARERLDASYANTHKITLSGDLYRQDRQRLNYQTSLERIESNNGYTTRLSNDLNYRFANYALGNQLDWRWHKDQEHGLGSLNFRANLRRLYGRLSVGYDVYPELKVNNYAIDINRSFNNTVQGQLRFNRAVESDIDSTELGLNFSFDDIVLNTSAKYDSEQEWQLLLSTRFSFGYNQVSNQFFGTKQRLTNKGSIVARVFLDTNNNGQFDEGEPPLSGVAIRAVQSYRKATTGDDGVAVLEGVIANRRTDIEVIPTSFADPFMLPSQQGHSITPRSGSIDSIDIPIVYSGEIEGVLHHQNGKPIAYTALSLKNTAAEVVATTISEFDGYYLFTDITPGDYGVYVDEQKLESKKLSYQNKAKVSLSPSGDVVSDVNIQLKDQQKHSGYVVVAGQFSSLDILKAYWALIQPQWEQVLGVSAFFIKQPQGQWLLGVAFAKEQDGHLAALCENAQQKNLQCEVKHVQFYQ